MFFNTVLIFNLLILYCLVISGEGPEDFSASLVVTVPVWDQALFSAAGFIGSPSEYVFWLQNQVRAHS